MAHRVAEANQLCVFLFSSLRVDLTNVLFIFYLALDSSYVNLKFNELTSDVEILYCTSIYSGGFPFPVLSFISRMFYRSTFTRFVDYSETCTP